MRPPRSILYTRPTPIPKPARQRQANSDHHAFNEGNAGNERNLWNNALSGPTNYVGLGRYLHYRQDMFSHKGFSSSWYGQFGYNGVDWPVFGGPVVDNTSHDTGKAAEMVAATWR